MSKRLTIDDVRKYVKENSECTLLSTEYINARTKLRFRCKCGKIFERTFDNFKRKKTTLCRSCSNIRPMSNNIKIKLSKEHQTPITEVKDLIENQMGCKYIKRYTRKNTRSTVIVFECPIHGRQEVYWTNIIKRKGCPMCNESNKQHSKNMIEVESWLHKNNITFIKEKKFQKCRDKRALPFDYYLPDKNICIEVDGRQHFEKVYFGGISDLKAKRQLEYIQRHDKIKSNYCLKNNIKLIRIPYFKKNEIDNILKSALS